jgi:hypothetical protein
MCFEPGGRVILNFRGPSEVREPLERMIHALVDRRSVTVKPPSRFSREWQYTFTTTRAADVVADSLLGIFDDGFELDRDTLDRFFSFWSLEADPAPLRKLLP